MLIETSRPSECLAAPACTRAATPSRIRSRTALPSKRRLSSMRVIPAVFLFESIARARVAAAQARGEPALPVGRGAVRERIGRHGPPRTALQPVVADGRRGREPFVEVTGLEHARGLIRVIGPDAREAVGLKLHRNLQAVGPGLVRALLSRTHLLRSAEQRLHVMTDLVADDVRRREIAGAAHARKLVEERRVEIHALVARTIERARRRARETAGRLNRAAEQRELGRRISFAGLREHGAPDVLGAAEHPRDENADLVSGRQGPALFAARRAGAAREELHDGVGPTENEHEPEDHEQPDSAAETAAAANRQRYSPPAAKAARPAHVADVVTSSSVFP